MSKTYTYLCKELLPFSFFFSIEFCKIASSIVSNWITAVSKPGRSGERGLASGWIPGTSCFLGPKDAVEGTHDTLVADSAELWSTGLGQGSTDTGLVTIRLGILPTLLPSTPLRFCITLHIAVDSNARGSIGGPTQSCRQWIGYSVHKCYD